MLDALQEIDDAVMGNSSPVITKELICEYNRRLLDGTQHDSQVLPGKVRDFSVVVSAIEVHRPKTASTYWNA